MALAKFLDPKNDLAFRRIFGTERHKDILNRFINDILGLEDDYQVKNVQFLSTILDAEVPSEKQVIVDVLCTDQRGAQILIEMQVAKEADFIKRVQFYAGRAYSKQARAGGKYKHLKEVIVISIVNFILFPEDEDYRSDYALLNVKTYKRDLKDYYFTFLELPKFHKTREDQLENIVEKWVYFFKYAGETTEDDLKKIVDNDPIIGKAYDVLKQCNWTSEELLAYDRVEEQIDVYLSSLQSEREEGEITGEIRGEIKGKIAVAKNLLKVGMPIDKVAEVTGLAVEMIINNS